MALLFFDSFDTYTTNADFQKRWNADDFQTTSFQSITSAAGRNSTNGCRFTNNAHIGRTLGVNAGTLIAGFYYTGAASQTVANWLCAFNDGASNQIGVMFDGAGHLQVRRGINLGTFGGTTLGTGTKFLSNGVGHYIEVKIKFHGSTGTVDVRVDGVSDISLSGQNTIATANAYATRFYIGNRSGAENPRDWDDLYVCDDQGSANNDFLGDVRAVAIFPTGAGNYTQWTPSTGSNWQNVDDAAPNADTDYNSDSTVGHRDSFVMGDLPTGAASVLGVQYSLYARKDDAGTRQVAPFVRISSTDYDGTTVSVSSSYDSYRELRETSPATSTAWTPSEVNGMEYGYKEIA